jgi:hypothetical protein
MCIYEIRLNVAFRAAKNLFLKLFHAFLKHPVYKIRLDVAIN